MPPLTSSGGGRAKELHCSHSHIPAAAGEALGRVGGGGANWSQTTGNLSVLESSNTQVTVDTEAELDRLVTEWRETRLQVRSNMDDLFVSPHLSWLPRLT